MPKSTKRSIPIIRLASIALALLLLAAGCIDTPTDGNGDGNGGGNGGGGNGGGFSYNHERGSGASAEDFLNNEVYQQLIIEVDYVEGYQPTDQALDSVNKMLEQRLNKPEGISIDVSPEPIDTGGQNSYTVSEIRSLEEEYRDQYTEAGILSAYFLFLDGTFKEEKVLGLAYYNTSMAIMEETIRQHSGDLGEPPRYKIEATVLKHEFGHNLGLVGNGTPTVADHKTDGSAHCTTDGCLMEPAVETTNYFANIFDGTVPDLKSECLLDLEQNGGK